MTSLHLSVPTLQILRDLKSCYQLIDSMIDKDVIVKYSKESQTLF
ncbi:MAG TPA: hypothetical protein PKY56_09940 [Candidatus Kapabacteria bacterium]|nr:hypothetical protein [Candidatus Kapabacteria bacterium]HPO62250.1 hypothetical protein [Candidatus Kapabacteria bacterium]